MATTTTKEKTKKVAKSARRPNEGCTERKKRLFPDHPTGAWIRSEKRLALYLRDEMTCTYCSKKLKGAPPDQITLDHVIPRSALKVGANDASNLVTSCRACNARKRDGAPPKSAMARVKACTTRNLDPYIRRAKALIRSKGSFLAALENPTISA